MTYDGNKIHNLFYAEYPLVRSCQRCGKSNCYLGIHHPLPRSLFPEREYDVTNMILLCNDCHNACHPEGKAYKKFNDLKKEFNISHGKQPIRDSREYLRLQNKVDNIINYIMSNYPTISIPHQFR